MFRQEADLGRLWYGMVTRDEKGELRVYHPAEVADTEGDVAARRAWKSGIGGLPQWRDKKEPRKKRLREKRWGKQRPRKQRWQK